MCCKLTGFSDRLDIQEKGKKNLKDESLVFSLNSSMQDAAIYCH